MTIDELAEKFPDYDILKMDGYDECVLGIIWPIDHDHPVILYDTDLVIQKLMEDDGMDYQGAVEFHDFNQRQAYLGPNTPRFT